MKPLKRILYTLDSVLNKITRVLVFLLTSALIITVFLQVFCRYVLNNSLRWTTETACFLMVYMVFIGSSLALRNNEHVFIDISKLKLPNGLLKVLNVIAAVAVYFFIVCIIYFGALLAYKNVGSLSPIIKFPFTYLYLVLPVSGVLMLIFYTASLFRKAECSGKDGAES